MTAGEERACGWVEAYRQAWERGDAGGAAALFAPNATYRSHIFEEPHRGRDGVRAYWSRATADQSGVAVAIGDPVVEGDRAAVEWWTQMTGDDADEITLPGILFLRFAADGLCIELREYWAHENGRRPPFEGWGRERGRGDARTGIAVFATGYERAWKAGDAEAIPLLFAEDAVYRSHPFRDPHRGRAGVLEYTSRAYADEADVRCRFGTPIVATGTGAIEYWATMTEAGKEVTLAGGQMLAFDEAGLCTELREYWHTTGGHAAPPPGRDLIVRYAGPSPS